MSQDEPTPEERLRRMQAMFAQEGGVLAEDYEHFTGINPLGGAIRQSKAPRKSAERCAPQDPKRN